MWTRTSKTYIFNSFGKSQIKIFNVSRNLSSVFSQQENINHSKIFSLCEEYKKFNSGLPCFERKVKTKRQTQ